MEENSNKKLLNVKRERDPKDSIDKIISEDTENNPNIQIIKITKTSPSPSSNNSDESKTKSFIKEDNDYSSSELVFKYNSNNTNVQCSLCHKNISNNIKFLCDKCDNFIFCINCFLSNNEHREKFKDHKYQIIDNVNFPLFTEDWSANDEHKLLSIISKSGLNNWEEISKNMGIRGQVECESHYYSFYYTSKENSMPKKENIIIDDNKNIIEEIKNKNNEIQKKMSENLSKFEVNINEIIPETKPTKRKNRCLCLRKNTKNGEAESAAEILGYRPKRREFETEFMNDIEMEISHLEFNDDIGMKDSEKDKKLKYDVLRDYNLRLKERQKRKDFVLDKGLLDLRRQNRVESKLSMEEYEILLFLKPFCRFFNNSEFFDLFEGIVLEQQLKLTLNIISKLEGDKTFRTNKIGTFEDFEKYCENEKNLLRSRKNIINNVNGDNKNEINLLGNRVKRFFNYKDNSKNSDNIFENDEFELIKEMPYAISTFYELKIKIKEIVDEFKGNDLKKFKGKISSLIEKYDIEFETKEILTNFYFEKYKNKIEKNPKEDDSQETNEQIIIEEDEMDIEDKKNKNKNHHQKKDKNKKKELETGINTEIKDSNKKEIETEKKNNTEKNEEKKEEKK